ncbi:MAG: hypothetical protein WC760_01425 [Bacteroidia bacterium]|jgi:hypothetical protein
MQITADSGNYIHKNSVLVLVLFAVTVVFQLTAFKWMWGIESLSRILNMLFLFVLLLIGYFALTKRNYSLSIWQSYLVPGLFIFGGMFINILLNIITQPSQISLFGNSLPWLIYLVIPYFVIHRNIDPGRLWKYFYYFMFIANLLGIYSYYTVFNGAPNLRLILTPHGQFLCDNIAIYFPMLDGMAHFRYYGCFTEPGSLAMFIIPAVAYSFFYRKILGLIVLLTAFYLTFSLGGTISLIILAAVVIFIIFNRNRNSLILSFLALVLTSIMFWYYFSDSLNTEYEAKGNSATIREENFSSTFTNLPILLVKYPLGTKLSDTTDDMEKNKLFSGYNFVPGNYLQFGGILAFLGFIAVFVVSVYISFRMILRGDLTKDEKVVFSSIIALAPFIFQRLSIWDSSLFALLFAPYLLKRLDYRNQI